MQNGNPNAVIYAGTLVLSAAVACSTFLVWAGEVTGATYMAAVISPVVAGFIGAISALKGVQSGSEASAIGTAAAVATNGEPTAPAAPRRG
jgi:hypothetical protein